MARPPSCNTLSQTSLFPFLFGDSARQTASESIISPPSQTKGPVTFYSLVNPRRGFYRKTSKHD
ncbi:Uncharacterized protein APZ42_019299 [Daphnia magna]|uniref:Uncharacterized protein n=1 Tax=Daphnia magna TaxID=35525 RepID=A0A164YGP9_9CRUS|nr:Uncharacterized protein APZ42_019299 [Daphnia magna]